MFLAGLRESRRRFSGGFGVLRDCGNFTLPVIILSYPRIALNPRRESFASLARFIESRRSHLFRALPARLPHACITEVMCDKVASRTNVADGSGHGDREMNR
jgi:hypothetical protein